MLDWLQQVIIDECAEHGGPTERCQRIYRNLEGRWQRNRYWRAVQEGTNRYRARQRRITDGKA